MNPSMPLHPIVCFVNLPQTPRRIYGPRQSAAVVTKVLRSGALEFGGSGGTSFSPTPSGPMNHAMDLARFLPLRAARCLPTVKRPAKRIMGFKNEKHRLARRLLQSGADVSRTRDLIIANDALYQLSYRPSTSCTAIRSRRRQGRKCTRFPFSRLPGPPFSALTRRPPTSRTPYPLAPSRLALAAVTLQSSPRRAGSWADFVVLQPE